MSFGDSRKQESSEYLFLVPHSVIEKLDGIVKNSFMKLEQLCGAYERQYNEQINFFITYQNELVLELRTNNTDTEKKPPGWSGLEELINKIDFSNILPKNVRKISDRKMTTEEIQKYAIVRFSIDFSDGENREIIQNMQIFPNCVGNDEVPNFFDKVQWKTNETYTGSVSNIYDPSKFWMKFAEVDLLQNHLSKFYGEKKEDYVLSHSELAIGLNCAILINNVFYRGKIVRPDIQHPNWFIVFLYDHGIIYRVSCESLYKLHEKFGIFPALAVRCTLTNVSPIDNESWTQEAVDRFSELTKGNKKLTVKISHVKIRRKILEVYLTEPPTEENRKIPTLNYLLVQENLAKISWQPPVESEEDVYKRRKKFTYLFPIHEMIENGTAPAQLRLTEKLKKCVSWDVLFPELYKSVR